MGDGQAYEPVFFVTERVSATLTLLVTIDDLNRGLPTDTSLTRLWVQPDPIPGGTLLSVRRADCELCEFRPTRSLLEYVLPSEAADPTKRSSYAHGLDLTLQRFDAYDNHTVALLPDVLLEWRAVGLSDAGTTGLILVIIGLVLADTMPAAAYFYVSANNIARLFCRCFSVLTLRWHRCNT